MQKPTRGTILIFSCATILVSAATAFFVAKSASPTLVQTPPAHISNTSPSGTSSGSDLSRYSFTVQNTNKYSSDEQENIDVYERLNKSVVNITTQQLYYNWFSEPVPQAGNGGSGSIIDARGYVLTNRHVVQNAFKVYVGLADSSRFEAKVIGVDEENDLAVIKFTPPSSLSLKPIPYGTSDNLKVGQKVLAIGNPFGLDRTLTQGIVSGLGRPVSQTNQSDNGSSITVVIQNMIQTDASINPGNSGGPLLDSHGNLIGVNTMIYSPSGGSVGIGFAVPAITAQRIVPELIKYGKVIRGWLQITPIPLFSDLVDYMKNNGIPVAVDSGLLISEVKKGGNADKAGLRGGTSMVRTIANAFYVGGDIIVQINGTKVDSIAAFYSSLENTKPGDVVTVIYYHGDKKMSAQVKLTERQAM